jgi:hypothetical protein
VLSSLTLFLLSFLLLCSATPSRSLTCRLRLRSSSSSWRPCFRSCNGSEGFAAGHAWVRSCSEGGRGLDGATLATPTARLGMWMLVTSPLLFPCGYLPLGPAARRHTPGDHRGCGESTMSQGSWARE